MRAAVTLGVAHVGGVFQSAICATGQCPVFAIPAAELRAVVGGIGTMKTQQHSRYGCCRDHLGDRKANIVTWSAAPAA